MQHPGRLREQVAPGGRCNQIRAGRCRRPLSGAADDLPQPYMPVGRPGLGGESLDAPQDRLARHKAVDQVRAVLHQRCPHRRQRLPHAPRLLWRERPAGPLALDVPGQRLEDLAERQVGVPDTGVGVAAPTQRDQVGVRLAGPPCELLQQRRLAAACLAHDDGHRTLAGQSPIEQRVQTGQLLLAGDEPRRRRGGRCCDRDGGKGRRL